MMMAKMEMTKLYSYCNGRVSWPVVAQRENDNVARARRAGLRAWRGEIRSCTIHDNVPFGKGGGLSYVPRPSLHRSHEGLHDGRARWRCCCETEKGDKNTLAFGCVSFLGRVSERSCGVDSVSVRSRCCC